TSWGRRRGFLLREAPPGCCWVAFWRPSPVCRPCVTPGSRLPSEPEINRPMIGDASYGFSPQVEARWFACFTLVLRLREDLHRVRDHLPASASAGNQNRIQKRPAIPSFVVARTQASAAPYQMGDIPP